MIDKTAITFSLDAYLEKFEYFKSKGKGFSIYESDHSSYYNFLSTIKNKSINHFGFTTKSFDKKELEKFTFNGLELIVVYQNLSFIELEDKIEYLINKVIFPAFYQNIPIAFFSSNEQQAYSNVTIESSEIHQNLNRVFNLLYIEQLDNLLNHVNFKFKSSDNLYQNLDRIFYTPIEELFKNACESKNISYSPQVKMGSYFVDFIIEYHGRKAIIECDGRDYHNPNRDKERDKDLSKHGYKIFRFTGSQLYHAADACLDSALSEISSSRNKQLKTIDAELDNSQQKAVETVTGPIRVLAPAGSGKTKTLTNRIAHLINEGVEGSQILALAFNKKAAKEMKSRLEAKNIQVANKMTEEGVVVKTFHSFGYEIIKNDLNWKFDAKNETIQTRNLLRKAYSPYLDIKGYNSNDAIDIMLEALRRTKLELIPLEDVDLELEDGIASFKNTFNEYLKLQNQHNFFNFTDMIYLCLRILLKNKIQRNLIQNRFNYILIDEFQDLNEAQLLLMQILALPTNNLFIVGDDDQMIYGFTGAKVHHIIDFPNRFPQANDFTLEINYRSSKKIVKHSSWLIENNENRTPKNISPYFKNKQGIFKVSLADTLYEQAIEAVKWIENLHQKENSDWKNFAILFRYYEYQFPIAMMLDAKKIPHSPVNSQKLFKKNPGKDIYSYLTVLLHPSDAKPEDFKRILKRPNKYFTNTLIEKAINWDEFLKLDQDESLEDWRLKNITSFTQQVLNLSEELAQINNPLKIVTKIIEDFGLREFYKDITKITNEVDKAGDDIILEVILSVAATFENLNDFYSHIYQTINDPYVNPVQELNSNQPNEILLSSIHSSKGMEFKNVVFFNLTENKRIGTSDEEEEERRVCYVGTTRAIESLLITAPNEGYSKYLLELVKNPKFITQKNIQLKSLLAQTKIDSDLLKGEIGHFKNQSNDIYEFYPELNGEKKIIDFTKVTRLLDLRLAKIRNDFPELEGAEVQVTFPFFRNYLIKRRLGKVEKAQKEVELIESKIQKAKDQFLIKRRNEIEEASQRIQLIHSKIDNIQNEKLVALDDIINEINSELEFRTILDYQT